jgi:polysaccharide export outer membrane protein
LGLSACDDTTALVASSTPASAQVATALRLHVGDKIKIVVIGDDKISGEYDIDQTGDISIPAAGALHAAGRTRGDLETEIARRLVDRQFLRSPMVTVSVSSFRPFYVLGEVEKPGEYPYHTGLNILSAIAVAGGETYRANQSHALIQRAGETGFHSFPLSPDVPVNPGDLIKLPERYF